MLSTTSSKIFTLFFLVILIGAMAYIDSFQARNIETSTFPMIAEDETETSAEEQVIVTMYENKKISSEVIDGYSVETYQEFEVLKDADGNTVEVNPTSNYSYLKYKVK
ncbi:hypothetical protein [Bacillus sp. UMB0893]|nr:hypothetical protein [Bacillus sp. UMB0893]QNG60444.1 hypothetical protein H4O14_02635 [Bacillus sp. PAMC26568]